MRRNRITFLSGAIFLLLFLSSGSKIYSQNDVMMQAFYWNLPVDAVNKNGTWWDTLKIKARSLHNAGFTGMWVPPPSKGNWGIEDMGYGIFDNYDLGAYNQRGTIETRFGSKAELAAMIDSMHANSVQVYADVVLNHVYGDDSNSENNPAVKYYEQHEAYTNGAQHVPYPTNEIVWKIPNAGTGDYYIQIKGFYLDWGASYTQRGYDVYIDWTGAGPNGTDTWESEPNNGSGYYNVFPGSGRTVRGHAENSSDIDEYKITLSSSHDIIIKLTAKKEVTSPSWDWVWDDQTHGYYPVHVWHNGSDLAGSSLQAWTNTGISYVTHTGTGEANYSWNYSNFHPVDSLDWLGDGGTNDEIITNTKWFGNDFNTFSTTVQNRLKDWGYWLANTIHFDGFRLDFVRGFQISFAADWVNNLPLLSGNQRFIVAEYWGNSQVIHDWVTTMASDGADADCFDFPLKFTLTDMCNQNGSSWNMANLNHAGMVRNNTGQALSGTNIVTFVENHDSGKESDKWVTRDWDMAYAYIITHEGRPCVFYPHYYGVTQHDNNNPATTVTAPSSLRTDINKLIYVRKTYLGGSLTVLSEVGNPYPSGDTYDVYVARRAGNGTKSGAIIVLNNNESSTKSLWVDSSPSGWSNWANAVLCNAFDSTETTTVQADGRVNVSAPARGYKIWVKKSEYAVFAKTSAHNSQTNTETKLPENFTLDQNYPNPFNPSTKITFSTPQDGFVSVKIYNSIGQLVETLADRFMTSGKHELEWNAKNHSSGVYVYSVRWNDAVQSKAMMLMK